MTAIQLLRFERDQKLRETDHIVMIPDWPISDESKNSYLQYRQALRDITTQTPSLDADGNLTDITWPTAPND